MQDITLLEALDWPFSFFTQQAFSLLLFSPFRCPNGVAVSDTA